MRQLASLIVLSLWCAAAATADEPTLDSNTAFYQGETTNYIIYSPDGLKMVEWGATTDGYSFAFIPKAQTYDSADFMIGVNIFKIKDLTVDEVITSDTAGIREHYGEGVSIWLVDSIFAASDQIIPTYFVSDPDRFIPNVMIAYVDGQTELIVLELVVTDRAVRMKADDAFIECLEELKALTSAELEY
jgi:hypothetical protein